jgi:hypothetical protein
MSAPRLSERLRSGAAELIAAVAERLGRADMPHYRDADPALVQERVVRLVEAFLVAASGAPAAFVAHVRGIAEERADEGYFLGEIQAVLSALEARAWQIAAFGVDDPRALLHDLGAVSLLVGGAKDELARVYLARKQRADSEVARLQRRFQELFKGTEGHVEEP